MSKIKIALCQMNVIDNKQENISKAISMINEAASHNSNFVVLPEMFNCPYSNDKFVEYAENEKTSHTLDSISKLAKKHEIYILAGSIPEKKDSKIYNTSYLFDEKGNIIAKHRKMHLFDVDVEGGIYFKESDTLTPGNEFTVCETDFGKIGIGICYDVRFPQLAQISYLCYISDTTDLIRQYPKNKLIPLLVTYAKQHHLKLVITGQYPDSTLPTNKEIINLTGQTSLQQLWQIISHARLVVGNETGATHFAWIIKKPTIMLYGGGHFGLFRPNKTFCYIVSHPVMPCFGCGWDYCIYNQKPAPCVKDIPIGYISKILGQI